MRHALLLAVFFSGILTLAGGALTSAPPTSPKLRRAFEIVDGINYLPYTYRKGGCQGRGAIIALQLAARGIASNTYHLIANVDPDPKDPRLKFTYHIAPALFWDEKEEPVIIDPAFLPRPAKVSQWTRVLKAETKRHSFTKPGSVILDEEVVLAAPKGDPLVHVDEMDKMPSFDGETVNGVCAEMALYLKEDPKNAKKNKKLVEQVNWAAKTLYAMKPPKIANYDPKTGIACKFRPPPPAATGN